MDIETELAFIYTFIETLNKGGIRYCHWKSNASLHKALRGEADLDLLISTKDRDRFEYQCRVAGFKEVFSPKNKRYPGMKDFIGFDSNAGRLYHLHVHYKLILGEEGAKNYWLPIEEYVLSNTTLRHNVSVPTAEVELFILLLRISLKIRDIDILRGIVRGNSSIFPKDIIREYEFLLRQIDKNRFEEIVRNSNTGIPLRYFHEAIAAYKHKNPISLLALRSRTRRYMAKYRRYSLLVCRIRLFRYFLADRFFRLITPKKKRLSAGKMIAFVGADGAGKSTAVRETSIWLGSLLSVYQAYFGIPKTKFIKGYCIILSAFLKAIKICNQRSLPLLAKIIKSSYALIEATFWLFVAHARKKEYKKSMRLIARGYLVISDRYPLDIFDQITKDPMDRPMIPRILENHKNFLVQLLSRKETMIYQLIAEPDYIIALNVSLEKAHERAREPNLSHKDHEEKIVTVRKIKPSEKVKVINADESLDKTILQIRRAVWNFI